MAQGNSRWERLNERRGDRAKQQQDAADQKKLLLDRLKPKAKNEESSGLKEEAILSARVRDTDRYLDAIDRLPLYSLGEAEPATLSPEYREILHAAVSVSGRGERQALLVWPPERFSPSAVVNLVTLGSIGSAERTTSVVGGATTATRAEADPVRAVIFPYARSTHAAARRVQVDAEVVGTTNFEHYARQHAVKNDPAKDYHQVMSRVRSLDGRTLDGQVYPEFRHPVLDEVVPHGPPNGLSGKTAALLWRTHRKTDIGKLARSGLADDPSQGKFYTFELRAGDRLGVTLRSISPAPDFLLLDLTRVGRQRLGWDWSMRAKEMVECLREVHPSAGILAITDDPWTFNAVQFDVLGVRKYGKRGKAAPAPGRTILALSGGILATKVPPEFDGCQSVQIEGFYGQIGSISEELRSLAAKVRDTGDHAAADLISDLGVTVRRTASLPGSVTEFSQFLEAETSAAMASDRIAAYRGTGILKDLSDPDSVASQIDAGSVVRDKVAEIMSGLADATPMASLLDDALAPSLRSASKSLFIFRSDMIAEFASHRLSGNAKLAERLDSGMIAFGGSDALDAIAASTSVVRNRVKRAVLVAPTRASILKFFVRPWLPENITILADADTLAYAARDASKLSFELRDHAIGHRLSTFSECALERTEGIGRHVTNLDKMPPLDDLDPQDTSVIDLTGGNRGERELLEFTLYSGQRVISRKGTRLVLRDDAAAVTSYVERQASEVRVGDEMCAIGPAFIERARSLVNIRATAAEEIRTYHEIIRERFAELPGASVAARLRWLVDAMGEPLETPEKARYWISLEDEIDKPMHEVVPHAPQDKSTFMRFTRALGIGTSVAENFWLWAVVSQRSHRMRSGNVFHDAFRGILTDPHAALAQNRDRQGDIRALRMMAEEHVSIVREIRRVAAA